MLDAENWCEYGASPIAQVLAYKPAGSAVAVEKSKTSRFVYVELPTTYFPLTTLGVAERVNASDGVAARSADARIEERIVGSLF